MQDYRHLILITGYEGTGENVLMFTRDITGKQLKRALKATKKEFEDIEEISREDMQHHVFEPLYLDPVEESNILTYN